MNLLTAHRARSRDIAPTPLRSGTTARATHAESLQGMHVDPALGVGTPSNTPSVADVLMAVLVDLADMPSDFGERSRSTKPRANVFEVLGGPAVPLVEAALRNPRLRVVKAHSESVGAFAAVEASVVTNRVVGLIVTTGPGIVAALWGLASGRFEPARVILFSPRSPLRDAGSRPVQDTSSYFPYHRLGDGGLVFDSVIELNDPCQLPQVMVHLRHTFSERSGRIVHVSVPADVLTAPCREVPSLARHEITPPAPGARAMLRVVEDLSEPFATFLGQGANSCPTEVRRFIERTGTPVLTSPRGKGVIPDDHPQVLGHVGNGERPGIPEFLDRLGVQRILVLGSARGAASRGSPPLRPPHGFIHVDEDTSVAASSDPFVPSLGVCSTIEEFLLALEQHSLPRFTWRENNPFLGARNGSHAA